MANSRRRRSSRRSRRARLPIGTIILVLFLLTLIAVAAVLVDKQIKGYFASPSHRRPAAVTAESATPGQSAQSASASPLSPGPSPVAGAKVAIIIDDCGYNVERCKRFLALPIPITLAILPMTPHGKEINADALAAGKSVILHLPMEPESPRADPGPGAITTQMSDDQVRAQVQADLDSLPGTPGANNHMGSKATSDPRIMRDILEVLRKRHLFFIDSMTSYSTVGASTARELGIPTAQRNVFLDNNKDLPYIAGQIKQVEEVALRRGSAIAIGHPFDSTAQALAEAIPRMQADGIIFVPAASLVK